MSTNFVENCAHGGKNKIKKKSEPKLSNFVLITRHFISQMPTRDPGHGVRVHILNKIYSSYKNFTKIKDLQNFNLIKDWYDFRIIGKVPKMLKKLTGN